MTAARYPVGGARGAPFGPARPATRTPTPEPSGSDRHAVEAWRMSDAALLDCLRFTFSGPRAVAVRAEARRRGLL